MDRETALGRLGAMFGGAALGFDAGIRHKSWREGVGQFLAPLTYHQKESGTADFNSTWTFAALVLGDLVTGLIAPDFAGGFSSIFSGQSLAQTTASFIVWKLGYNLITNFCMEANDARVQWIENRGSRR